MIHISLSPNLQKDDALTALRGLFFVWEWRKGKNIQKLKKEFAQYFNAQNIYLFNSGRSALFVFLKSLNLKETDEIIIQSFTCNAVANPIIWAGAKPVYTDIDETFNIDTQNLKNSINENTKAIIIQNTFGIPARIDKILEIAKTNNILVIEDCAHALGATYNGQKVGTFGDVAFFSFGRDKVISSVYGGAILFNNLQLEKSFINEYRKVRQSSIFWTVQQLLHPLITYTALLTYNFGGKYLLYGAQKLRLLSKAVTHGERYAKMPNYFPRKLSDPLSALALNQFRKLDTLNSHRRELARIYEANFKDREDVIYVENYDKGAIWLRYPILHDDAREIKYELKMRGNVVGDWYQEIVAPAETSLEAVNYPMGKNKTAEYAALRILNLPTNIRTNRMQAQEIASFIKAHNWKRGFEKQDL